jgi:hypothetical protein
MNLFKLPIEILRYILLHCDLVSLEKFRKVSNFAKKMLEEDYFWRLKLEKDFDYEPSVETKSWKSTYFSKLREMWFDSLKRMEMSEIIKLLHLGMNPNVTDKGSITGPALVCAIEAENYHLVKKLLEFGADPNVKWISEYTPLFHILSNLSISSTNSRSEFYKTTVLPITSELLNFGANPNIQTQFGETPLHEACRGNKVEIVQKLLEFDANPNFKSVWGETPLDIVKDPYFGNPEIAKLFIEKIASS